MIKKYKAVVVMFVVFFVYFGWLVVNTIVLVFSLKCPVKPFSGSSGSSTLRTK